MNDLLYTLVFFALLGTGIALAKLCERLMPKNKGNKS